ncbi:GATA transcription factor 21-like [Argentina anserina]|uniref:GATA transcription factor 21-like n=1 Tax=Argentina anserina TaxID=57926 RepID=UPI0021765C6A|nr:GATA transcription factor 21-like [Potentilla anserina]
MKLMHKMTNQRDQVPENIPLTFKFQTAGRDDNHRETKTSSSRLTISNKKSRSSSVSAIRVCSECSTNTTPLWRSGPRGPKSLCNACGIRQRKGRRSMAEAAAAAATGLTGGTTGIATTKSTSVSKGKEKKSRRDHNVRVSCKKKGKLIITDDDNTSTAEPSKYYKRNDKQLCDFKQVAAFPPSVLFPLDVEEAAILLMNLSTCPTLNHS